MTHGQSPIFPWTLYPLIADAAHGSAGREARADLISIIAISAISLNFQIILPVNALFSERRIGSLLQMIRALREPTDMFRRNWRGLGRWRLG
jgi:hypothetical protein